MLPHRVAPWIALILAILFHGSVASSQEASYRDDARRLALEAAAQYQANEYEAALDLFRRAADLYDAPTLVYWQAKCLEGLGQLVEAEALYNKVTHWDLEPGAPEAFAQAQQDSLAALEELRGRLPKLVIVVDKRDDVVKVTIDDRVLPAPLIGAPVAVDPGVHTVVVTRRAGESKTESVSLEEGQRRELTITFPKPMVSTSDALPEPMPFEDDVPEDTRGGSVGTLLGWAGIGLGAVGAGVGVAAGLNAAEKHRQLSKDCPDGSCGADQHEKLDSFRTLRTISTVGYAVGALGIVGGGILLFASYGSEPDAASLAVSVGLSSVNLSAIF